MIKGWHLHHEMPLNSACIVGQVKVVLYDDRDGSCGRDRPIAYDWAGREASPG